jgi:hypothetical protein
MNNFASHPDFKKYYNQATKANIWVLGYFGGGSINVSDAFTIAQAFARENNVPVNTVHIDEIEESRRFKGFKYVFSRVDQEKVEGVDYEEVKGDVISYLTD